MNWPGYAAFTPYKGTVGLWPILGPAASDLAAHHGRVGVPGRVRPGAADRPPARRRRGVRRAGYTATGIGASWLTATGIPLGWTHQFLSRPLLDLPAATVRHGRLAPEGPAYKALLVEATSLRLAVTLALSDARALLRLARAGLPVVLLGPGTPWSRPASRTAASDALRSVVTSWWPNRWSSGAGTDKSAVPTALANWVAPTSGLHDLLPTLLDAHRVADGVDYYYFCNGKHAETVKPPVAAIDHEVALRRTTAGAVPYLLDPWTGRSERLARYTERARRRHRSRHPPARRDPDPGPRPPGLFGDRAGSFHPPHAFGSEADEVRFTDADSPSGRPRTPYSAGPVLRPRPCGRRSRPSAPMDLASWQLHVQDWRPGDTPYRTTVVEHDLTLDALLPLVADRRAARSISEIGQAPHHGHPRQQVDQAATVPAWNWAPSPTPAASPSTATASTPWTRSIRWWTSATCLRRRGQCHRGRGRHPALQPAAGRDPASTAVPRVSRTGCSGRCGWCRTARHGSTDRAVCRSVPVVEGRPTSTACISRPT